MKLALRTICQLNEQSPRLLGALCLAVLLIILTAGLWPFNFLASNQVAWLPDQNGVHFYGQGIIVSSDVLNKERKPLFPDKSITLEILLRPLLVTGNLPHILTLYDGKAPDIFFVGQWRSHLIIRSRTDNPTMRKKGQDYGEIGLNNALLKDQDCFLTITSGVGGTAIYVNGKLMRSYAHHQMLAGVTESPIRLILGNSSTGESYWNGNLMGLAIYNRALPSDQVFQSYEAWTGNTPPPTSAEEGCLAIYPFNERNGTTVRNTINANGPLTIPEKFKPVQRKTLSPFLLEYKWNLSSAQDIITNILGFIPFGFFFSALLLNYTRMKRLPVYLIIVLLGTGISFAIELTQAYLPTRDSSLTDVVMNSTGTVLGIITFRSSVARALHLLLIDTIGPRRDSRNEASSS
jgi:VanZ family protein